MDLRRLLVPILIYIGIDIYIVKYSAYIAIWEFTVEIKAVETPIAAASLVHKIIFCINLFLITNQFEPTFNKTIFWTQSEKLWAAVEMQNRCSNK